jgi:hypothetical protein
MAFEILLDVGRAAHTCARPRTSVCASRHQK